jgi:hypothetical protein
MAKHMLNTQNKLIISLSISFIFFILYLFLFNFIRYNEADTHNFVNAAKMLFGDTSVSETQSRITKPVVLIVPGALHYFFGITIEKVMLLQNIIFFLLTGVLFGQLLSLLGFNEKVQYIAIFVLFTIQPIAVHAFELINDIAGFFFSIFILYLYFLYRKSDNISISKYIVLTLVIIAGILSKESSGLAVLIIGAETLVKFSKRRFISNGIMFVVSATSVFLVQWVIKTHFQTQDVLTNVVEEFQLNDGLFIRPEQIIHSFDAYWLFIGLGVLLLLKYLKTYEHAKTLLLAGVITLPFLFLWSTVQDRTIAVAAPLFVVYILFAIEKFPLQKVFVSLIITAGILNILVTYLIYKHNIENLLEFYLAAYTIIFATSLAIAMIKQKKQI